MSTGPQPIAVIGPTASGKSALALRLARELAGCEIVSMDSMQVYRGMDIGTAKPTAEEQAEVRHHLIDLVDPWEEFSVAEFQLVWREAMDAIEARGARALLVGGTGLYLHATIDAFDIPGRFPDVRAELDREPDTGALHTRLAGLDPVAAGRMEPDNRRRVVRALEVTIGSGRPFSSFGPGVDQFPPTPVRLIGLRVERSELDHRIRARYDAQLAAGFLDEVRVLRSSGCAMSRTAAQALGYRELWQHLDGQLALDEAIELACVRTRQFAVRQQRWFLRDPRVEWVSAGADDNPFAAVVDLLQG